MKYPVAYVVNFLDSNCLKLIVMLKGVGFLLLFDFLIFYRYFAQNQVKVACFTVLNSTCSYNINWYILMMQIHTHSDTYSFIGITKINVIYTLVVTTNISLLFFLPFFHFFSKFPLQCLQMSPRFKLLSSNYPLTFVFACFFFGKFILFCLPNFHLLFSIY